MSDSAKLRFVYALISYISSFLDIVAIIVLSFLVEFDIIHSDFVLLIVLLVCALLFLIAATIGNFIALYGIGKKEK